MSELAEELTFSKLWQKELADYLREWMHLSEIEQLRYI